MRRRYTVLSLAIGILACLIMAGCAGNVPANPPGALNIAAFSLSGGALNVPYKQLLIASGGLTPYTWTISSGSLPPGITVTTDGVVSGTPVTDPSCPSYPCTYNFTVKVTDSQTPTPAYQTTPLSIVINQDLSLAPASLPVGTANVPYNGTFSASNGVPPYTYAVYGNTMLPAGLTLSTIMPMGSGPNGATITGTPTTAGVYSFTIQATDSLQETATANFTITVVGRVEGNYSFTLNGFQNGTPFYMVGSLCADGNGNINPAGNPSCPGNVNTCNGATGMYTLDENGPGGVQQCIPFTGNYSLAPGSNFGFISLQTPLGVYQLEVVVSSEGDSRLIVVNPGITGSGRLIKQTATTVTPGGGSFTFGLYGNDPSGLRYAAAGMFGLNASLAVIGGAEDIDDNGTVSGEQCVVGGTFNPSDPNTGRGTVTLMLEPLQSGTCSTQNPTAYNYAYYVASATELVAIDTDSGGPSTVADILEQQSAGISGGLVVCKSGQACQNVLALDGTNTNNTVPEAEVGVISGDGNGNITRTDGLPSYYLDTNYGGNVGSIQYTAGTYSVDATCGLIATPCGRVTVTLQGDTNPPVWYLVGTGQGFVVGTDPDVTQGMMQPQSGAPFTVASLLGSYLGGTISPTTSSIFNEIDVAGTPPPGGTWAVTYYSNGPGGAQTNQSYAIPYVLDPTAGAAFGKFDINSTMGDPAQIVYVYGGGASGATGGKSGVVGINVGILESDGTTQPDPNPRLSVYGH